MNNMFYDYNKVLSYNAMLNFIIGERGVGKTYGSIKYVVNKFIKTDEQFVYLRRYKTELEKSVPRFFDAIKNNNEFKDTSLYSKSSTFYCNDKICGYALPLSTANILKSTTYDKVTTIIFDEFIIDKGCYHYLPNEVEKMLDIIETIGRLRNIRVLFLGNAISSTNPYFVYFNLTLPYNNDIKTFKDGLILINYIKNETYRDFKRKTKFGKLIEDTKYSKYAIDNEFLRDSKTFVQKKTPKSKFYFKVYFKEKYIGIWTDHSEQLMFISYDYDKDCPIEFSFNSDDHNETTILIRSKRSVHFQALLNYYRLGKLRFENQKIKNEFMEFLVKHLPY